MKIMITGRPGAGKTTFARKLATATNLPLYHTDKHFFLANWEKNPAFGEWMETVVQKKEWIIEGISSRYFEPRLQHADYLIIFKMPYWQCLWRIIKRRFSNKPRPDCPKGCFDKLSVSFIHYLFTVEKRFRRRLYPLLAKYPHIKVVEVHSDKEAELVHKKLDGLPLVPRDG